jgi:molybdopterin-guanine dinucleotide biosynthesis protein A
MPFVSCELVRFLSSRIEDHDVAVPRHGDRAEPLHAVWSSGVAVRVEEALSAGERAVHRALERLRVAWIEEDEWRPLDPEARSFVNINTLEELYQLINP